MVESQEIKVEVAYTLPHEQCLLELRLGQGASVNDAIQISGILQRFPQIDLTKQKVGVFGQFVELDAILSDGDRVEIYRPLEISPKQARRLRAQRVGNQ